MVSDPFHQPVDPAVAQIIEPLYRARGWMKLLAVLGFVAGGLYAITIVGVVVAWIPILIGAFVWQSATAIEAAYTAGSVSEARRGLDKLRLVFIAYGVLAVLGLALFAFLLVAGIGISLLEDAERVMR